LGIQTVSHETTIQREWVDLARRSGLSELLRAHWEEVADDKSVIALNVDWSAYLQMEKAGSFVGFSVRAGTALVGYSGFFVNRSPHYRDHVFALNDVIYLKPAYRGVTGLRLIIETETALADMGVSKILYHTKATALLGNETRDSLSVIEDFLDVEDKYKIRLSDELMAGAGTLAEVLRGLGYSHAENIMGKLLVGGR
jgi:hypothetical protein